MALARCNFCVRNVKACVVPFTAKRPHLSHTRLQATCTRPSSHNSDHVEQQTTSRDLSSSPAVFLARGVLETAGQGARELLSSPCSLVAVVALMLYLAPTDTAAAAAHHQPLYTLAEGEEGGAEFWSNVARYARYFVSVLLGTGYVMVKPVLEAFKRPVSALTAIAAIVGGVILLKFVLNAMLGIDEPFIYEPGNVVPYNP